MSLHFSILDFGARSGTLSTEAIQAAIDAAAAVGGTVLVPAGTFISGSLFLKSGITLHLSPQAVLQASRDLADYPARPHATDSGDIQPYHFLTIAGQEKVVLTGGGTLDGQGFAFWDPPQGASPWYRPKAKRVIPMVECADSRHIVFENILLRDSPGWTLHLRSCEDVKVRGVRIENHLYGPNTDGIDVNGCRDVFISDCRIRCGDDGIILKALKGAGPTERVVVQNCIVQSNCIGIGIGCETASDVRQIAISNCILHGCHRMFAIGMWEGGTVEEVRVANIVGDTLGDPALARPIHIDMKRHPVNPDPASPVGFLRNVHVNGFTARTRGRILLTAEEGGWLEDVSLCDIHLSLEGDEDPEALSPPDGRTGSAQYSNYNLEARRQRAALIVENARNFSLRNFRLDRTRFTGHFPFQALWARNTPGLCLEGVPASGAPE